MSISNFNTLHLIITIVGDHTQVYCPNERTKIDFIVLNNKTEKNFNWING